MTTILIINAISSGLAAAGIGGFAVRARRRAQRERPPVFIPVEDRPHRHTR
jgi:hypothetical protein